MSFPETIHYLDSFINYEKKSSYPYKESFKLERVRDFLSLLGNPQDSLRCLHIAGTKGKGSVCAFAAYILKDAGYTVGLYTSPHLSDVRERIRILKKESTRTAGHRIPEERDFEGMISKRELDELVARLKPAIDKFNKDSKWGPLSFFEIYTVLAFQYFKEQKTDFVVLETGLGGRLDATNVVSPRVCGITSISFDHMDKLGSSLTEIAREKSGIIKGPKVSMSQCPKLVVVGAPQEPEAQKVIRAKCKQEGAYFYEIGRDIVYNNVHSCLDYQEFEISGALGDFDGLRIRLLGRHQLINATLGICLVAALNITDNIRIKKSFVRTGVYNTVWPGRFQFVSGAASMILDGAHNSASAIVLRGNIKEYFAGKRVILILGVSRDKDIKGICAALIPVAAECIITRAHNPRAAAPEDLLPYVREFAGDKKIHMTPDCQSALELARKKTGEDCVILITGSLFLVAEAREMLTHDRA